LALPFTHVAAQGNIDPANKFAWSENAGWNNFAPTHGGVAVHLNGSNGYLSGYVWSENIGWIKLGTGTGPYANTAAGNYGVNMDAAGNLSGYAWSENSGWINFHPSHGQVAVNLTTGVFDGYAWGENVGWVHFKSASPAYNVRMTAIPCTVTFDPKGGTVSPSIVTVTNSLAYGALPTPAWPGQSFAGWYTNVTYTGVQVTSNTVVTAGANHTLYAKWTQISHTLTVISARGGSYPGTVTTNWGTALSQWVTNSPVANGVSTQYVCAGASVLSNAYDTQTCPTNVTLTLTNNATLTWQWQTRYRLATGTNGNGSVTAAGGWYASGSNAVLTASAGTNWHFSGWSGETNGCVWVGNLITAAMTQARSITANFAIDQKTLTVVSAQGGVSPGTQTANWGAAISQWVTNSPVANGATQYVCSGASVLSNAYTQVSPTNVTLTITNNAVLTWQWQTRYRLATGTNGNGNVTSADGWYASGSNAVLTASAGAYWQFAGWGGNTNGCIVAGNVITAAMTEARTIIANFSALTVCTVTFYATGGTVSPGTRAVTNSLPYGALPVPERPGYAFMGWYADAACAGISVTAATTVTATSDHTLYAKWEPDTVPVGRTSAVQTVADNSGDGGTSIRLGGIGLLADGQMAGIEWVATGPGVLSFDWKVSSEAGYDWLRFYEVGTGATNRISGTGAGWARVFVTVSGGPDTVHTFRWEYEKDVLEYVGEDCGWVDAITWTPAYALTVSGGAGSGAYTNGQAVAVTADTPPGGYMFDRWTGATQVVANVTSAVTTVTMPASAISITAAYRLTPLSVAAGVAVTPIGHTNAVRTATENSGDGGMSVKLGGLGLIQDNGVAGFEWTTTGPGMLVFDWRVSSEQDYDELRFYEVGGSVTNDISGTGGGWTRFALTVLGAADAVHTFRWEYAKDGLDYVGLDCGWVDAVVWLPVYALTVNSGTGGGYYTNNTPVAITADAPPQWQRFDRWSGDTNRVANVLASATTLVMPATGVVVTATYTPMLYTLTVVNGSGGGAYPYASAVEISAATYAGKRFYRWTGDVETVADAAAATTTVVTAGHTLSIAATYSVPLTVNAGTGGGWYPEGATANVAADPDPLWMEFDVWTGDAAGLLAAPVSRMTSLTMPTRPASVAATYRDSLARVAGCYGRTFTRSGAAGGVSTDPNADSPSGTPAVKLGGAGVVPDNGFAAFETVVSGGGTVTFWWRVSSESNADYLKFKVDGVQVAAISGTKGAWAQVTQRVNGAGVSHALRWEYVKNGSLASSTDAGWVDDIVWTGDVSDPTITPDIRTTDATNSVFAFTFLGERGIPYTVYSNATLNASGWVPMLVMPQQRGETNGIFLFETIVFPPIGQRSGFYKIIGGDSP
jgi:uncharacterized repeat protein (TIGR02543 family)